MTAHIQPFNSAKRNRRTAALFNKSEMATRETSSSEFSFALARHSRRATT